MIQIAAYAAGAERPMERPPSGRAPEKTVIGLSPVENIITKEVSHMKRIRTILSLVLCFTMLLSLSLVFNGFADPDNLSGMREPTKVFTVGTPSTSYSNSYTDVPTSIWCYHPVMTLTEGGLLAGYGGGKFGPNDSLTRAQTAIIFTRLVGNQPGGNVLGYEIFEDNTVASRAFTAIFYAGRLEESLGGGSTTLTQTETATLKDAGSVNGGMLTQISSSGKFGITTNAIYDAWYASVAAGRNVTPITSVDDLPDGDDIHKWIDENYEIMGKVLIMKSATKEQIIAACERAICRAYNLGMIGGVDSKGTFNPYGALTRGQIAQILYNVGWTYEGVLDY